MHVVYVKFIPTYKTTLRETRRFSPERASNAFHCTAITQSQQSERRVFIKLMYAQGLIALGLIVSFEKFIMLRAAFDLYETQNVN